MHRDIPGLTQGIEACKFKCRQNLRSVVIERSRRVGDEKTQLFQASGIATDQVALHRAKGAFRRLSSASHLSQADDSGVGFDFNDCADESSPMAAICMAQWGLKRHSDGGGSEV